MRARNCKTSKLVLCDLKFSPNGKCEVRKYLMTNRVTGVKVRPHRTIWPAGSPMAYGLGPEDTYADTLDAAAKMGAWWDDQLASKASGVGDMLCDMLDAWIDANRARWAPSTVAKYRANSRLHVRPYMEGVRVSECRPFMFDDLFDLLAEEGTERGRPLSANTVRGVYQNLKSAFDWGMVMGWAEGNPLSFVAKPKPGRYTAEFLRPAQVGSLAARLDDALSGHPESYAPRRRCALFAAWLSLRTGLRLGEVCALRVRDVWRDLMTDEVLGVSVSGTVTETGGLRRLDRPKSASSNRKVPVASAFAGEIAAFVEWTETMRGVPAGEDRPLVTVDGGWMRPSYVSRVFSELRDELGLPGAVTFHSLRHTYASIHLSVLNTPVVDVAKYLGHASPEVTNRVYAHVMRAGGAEDAEAYAKAVGKMGGA